MPTIDFGAAVQDGVDYANHTVANTNWDTYTFGDTVQRVQIRSRSGDIRLSRTLTGSFNAADTRYQTLPAGREYILEVTSPVGAQTGRVGAIQISHSDAAGVIEFELLTGGR